MSVTAWHMIWWHPLRLSHNLECSLLYTSQNWQILYNYTVWLKINKDRLVNQFHFPLWAAGTASSSLFVYVVSCSTNCYLMYTLITIFQPLLVPVIIAAAAARILVLQSPAVASNYVNTRSHIPLVRITMCCLLFQHTLSLKAGISARLDSLLQRPGFP